MVVFFVFFSPENAQAMLLKKDLETLATEAQVIMNGKVTTLQSVWKDKKIYTYVTVSVQDFFKGDGGKEVVIKVPGGTVGEITCCVSDMPAFKKGEEIFAFLRGKGEYYEIVGAQQGKYTVQKDKVMGLDVTVNNILNYKGSFIDDLVVEKYNGPVPEITDVSPNSGPAVAKDLNTYEASEDSTEVTISGSNFGSSQGIVEFWAGQGDSEFTYATIKSWSENQIDCLVPGGASSYNDPFGAGNVYVITDEDIESDPALFRVTYSCMGGKLPGNKLIYEVNAGTADCGGEENAVQKAADAWNNAGANFQFEYGGPTDKTSIGLDGENSVIWIDKGETDWLARCWTYWYSSDPTIAVEADIEFSDYYNWSTAANCSLEQNDVQNIATHELGHALGGLADLYGTADSEKTMYGFSSNGETKKRTLEPDDIEGINYLYGLAAPAGALEGVVRLEKVNSTDPEPDSPLADHSGTEVSVFLQGSQVKSSLSEKDGFYLVDGLAAGTYDVHYCRPGWSKVERKDISLAVGETKELSSLTLVVGDMNQDNQINILDLLWMAAGIGLSPENPEWPEHQVADVNKDYTINILDLLRVAKNIGKRP